MFNPLYTEIYQFAAVVLAILLAALMIHKVRYWKREAEFYQKELTASWKRAQWKTHQNRQLPEDWSLRGTPADFENEKHLLWAEAFARMQLSKLSDEQFAEVVLLGLEERLKWHRDTRDWRNVEFTEYAQDQRDKVFTRLAGRIFRAVEKHRNL